MKKPMHTRLDAGWMAVLINDVRKSPYGWVRRKNRRPVGFGIETWFCPPLVVMGSSEVHPTRGIRSGLSCRIQPVADAGQMKPSAPGVLFVMLTMGTKFATSVRFATAVKE